MDKLTKVGKYKADFNKILGINLPTTAIYVSDGFKKHIFKRHPDCQKYIKNLSDIIKSPDYIGVNPKEPDSIELVKVYSDNVQIGIKLDKKANYLYVATLFDVNTSKLQRRINSGRLKKFK